MKIILCIFGYLAIGGLVLLLFIRDCVKEGSFTPDDAGLDLLCGLMWPLFALVNIFAIIIPEIFKKVTVAVAAIFEAEGEDK